MKQKTGNILKVVIFFLLPVVSHAQLENELDFYNEKKHKLNHNGMKVLTVWSSVNIVSGTACFLTNSDEEKYFYAMNSIWGLVNLSIAVPGLLTKKKSYQGKFDLLKDQRKTEKVFLVNAVLDIAYITGGVLMKEISKNQQDKWRQDMFSGFGNSFIIQGAGLFLFDTAMTLLNFSQRKKHLKPILENSSIAICPSGLVIKRSF